MQSLAGEAPLDLRLVRNIPRSRGAFLVEVVEVRARVPSDNSFNLREGIPSIYGGRRSVTRFDFGISLAG